MVGVCYLLIMNKFLAKFSDFNPKQEKAIESFRNKGKKLSESDRKIVLEYCNIIRRYLSRTNGSCKGVKNIDAVKIFAKLIGDDSITEESGHLYCMKWLLQKGSSGEINTIKAKKTKKLNLVVKTNIKINPSIESKLSKKDEYTKFLKSKYWRNIRQLVISRDKRACTKCGRSDKLHVHHITYINHLREHEHLDDLITLCKDCHDKEHGAKK